MVQSRSRRAAPSFGRRPPGAASGFSAEELKLIPQLLQLFRSGAFTALLPSVPVITETPALQKPAISPVSHVSSRNAKAQKKQAVSSAPLTPGWTPVKRVTAAVSSVKDQLLKDGWSVPVFGSVADLNISEPGVCLVSSSEARKAVAELKGAHPLAILSPANIENRGQELHVLVEKLLVAALSADVFFFNLESETSHIWMASRRRHSNPTASKLS